MTETETAITVAVVSPATGEILSLDSPTDRLAGWLADVRTWEEETREAKRIVSREILARQDHDACWTTHINGFKITGQSPSPEESWDGAELRTALLALVDADVLSIDAVDNAVETIVSYKPRKQGITALRKLGGQVAEVVDSLCVESERERRVSVSRS